jgi:hypothetical protein
MRTTIDLPDELFRQAEARAALQGRRLKDLIVEYVQQGLERGPEPDYRDLRRRTPLPLLPATGTPIPALSSEELARIEEEDDLARLGRCAGH